MLVTRLANMARREDKEKAIKLRKKGYSYTQIKDELGVGKGTLSAWLRDMPLSDSRLRELRDYSQIRIEKTRETKRRKKEERRSLVYKKVSYDIEHSKSSEFVAGFYLYWGEGTKTSEYSISLTNSDPSVIRCFVEWVGLLGVDKDILKIKLHTYDDQQEDDLKIFWSNVSGVPIENFYKTYKKKTLAGRKTYKGMFPYGTCVIAYHNRDIYEYVMEGIKYLRYKYSK